MKDLTHKKDFVYQQLKEDILTGKYKADTKLPKELDFAKELGVGKITLRSALSRLAEEGLVARIPSKGTFVLDQSNNAAAEKQILMITSNLENMESPNKYIVPAAESTAVKLGCKTAICDYGFIDSLSSDELLESLKQKNIIGIIAAMENFTGDEEIIEQLHSTKLPVVLPHGHAEDTRLTGFASIYTPPKGAWCDAVTHLHEQGHQRVATLGLNKNRFRENTEEEHLSLLASYNMSTDKELLRYAPYEQESVTEVVNNWLDLDVPPTAILCFSDFIAIRVYEALKARNMQIPDDIAVMGFCGYPGGDFMSPPLSTIDLEYSEMGRLSVELLLKADEWFYCEDKTAVPQITKSHKLVVRESTGIKRVETKLREEFADA
ncbi:MAG: GntR family transcriptional regulator [Planctomycetota bacterium]|jgi:DNA-binding LacI/PurR family transcriptional regulator